MRKVFYSLLFLFPLIGNSQTIKITEILCCENLSDSGICLDYVTIYCQYDDLFKEICKDSGGASLTYWKNGRKIVDISPDEDVVKLKTLKKASLLNDTIEIFSEGMHYALDRLAKKYKLSYYDKQTNKKIVKIKQRVTGKSGQLLNYEYIDDDTKKPYYIAIKKTWRKF